MFSDYGSSEFERLLYLETLQQIQSIIATWRDATQDLHIDALTWQIATLIEQVGVDE